MEPQKKYYTARYDRVFKTVLGEEENKEFMKEFLSRIFNKKIDEILYLRTELPISDTEEKVKNVDMLIKSGDEYIHIELNSSSGKYLHIRNLAYFAAIYSKKTTRGELIDLASKYIHLDFTYKLSNDYDLEEHYTIQNPTHLYVDNFEIIEYNMDKIMKFWYAKDEENIQKYKHLIMLDLKSEDLKVLAKGDEFMENFRKQMDSLNNDERFQSLMTKEEDMEMVHNTEKFIAREEGKEESKLEIAKNMLEMNLDIETIIKATGLSKEEIESIKKD